MGQEGPEKVYLGDGLYVEWEAGQLKLTTFVRGDGEHYVYLEPAVWAALMQFVRKGPPHSATN